MGKMEETTYHLTPDGWACVEVAPLGTVVTGTWNDPDYMYGSSYWHETWRASDEAAVKGLLQKYGRDPRSPPRKKTVVT